MRLRPPSHPVTVRFDGEAIVAEKGEPVALSLIAAGHLALARSPKFHRPRGPWCLRGGCDGCLARIDGVPNRMACRTPAEDGMHVETQNTVGPRGTDLLRAADWFFPEGMNHHELLAGIPGAQRVLQSLARRVAGLGRLPAGGAPARSPAPAGAILGPARRDADVLVVGSGPSGMASALELSKRGRRVEVIDDALAWGGGVRLLASLGDGSWAGVLNTFGKAAATGRIQVRLQTTVAGVYGDDILVAGAAGVEVVTARTLVLAPGAHDGVLDFEGNDLPGVFSARAACLLLTHGVTVGPRPVVVLAGGERQFGEAYARAVPGAVVVHGRPRRAGGGKRVREVTVETAEGERPFVCDALVIDAPRAPAYEICAQAGATLTHDPRGFLASAAAGKVRDGVFVAGEAAGTPLDPAAVAREAARLPS